MRSRLSEWILGVVVPLVLIATILEADTLEGPKTAYVGVLSVVPMLSAVFGTPLMTVIVSVITLSSAYLFGLTASDGNVAAQNVRLVIISLISVIAVIASTARRRMQRALTKAQVSTARSEMMERHAYTDPMTGIFNRRGLTAALTSLAPGARSVAILDCDQLKAVNDRFGHLVGDEYITAVAKRLENSVSRRDLVARWGGDEFLVVLNAGPVEAHAVVQRLMSHISDTEIATASGSINATVTGGLADWPENASLDFAIRRADDAMYEAKALGRGKLAVASPAAD